MRRYLLTMIVSMMLISIIFAVEIEKPKEKTKKALPIKTAKVTLYTTTEEEPAIILKSVKDDYDDFISLDDFAKKNPYKGPLAAAIGEPLKWIANNADRWQGWSLTGYSHSWLTEDYKPARIKFGVVSYDSITDAEWADFDAWKYHGDRPKGYLGFQVTIIF